VWLLEFKVKNDQFRDTIMRKNFPHKISPLAGKRTSHSATKASLLADVVILTPSYEKLPSACPSAKQNSATSTNQNLPSNFWKVTSVDLEAE
jgi:hypothetical protein